MKLSTHAYITFQARSVARTRLNMAAVCFLPLVEVASELLEDGLLCLCVAFEVVAFLQLFQCLLLFLAQCFRYIYTDVHNEISRAVAITLYSRQSLAPQS